MSKTLVISEFQGASLGGRWNPEEKTVSRRELAILSRLAATSRNRLFEVGYSSLRATNWVGSIGLGGKCVEVVPKVDRDTADNLARENLYHMIARSGIVPFQSADLIEEKYSRKPLINAYMEIYLDHLAFEWRRGPVKSYVAREENRTFLKGKLLPAPHIRLNAIHKERFYTSSDEFTEDNTISQLLKAPIGICLRQNFSIEISRKAYMLFPDFEEVADRDFDAQALALIKVERQHRRFEPLVNLAKLILNEVSPNRSDSGGRIYSLMFNMNEVFEKFVAAELRRALAGTDMVAKYQFGGKSLLRDGMDGKEKFRLKPDLAVCRNGKILCLLDTKWKNLDHKQAHHGVSQADMYQMYAYGKEFNAQSVVLVYPRRPGQELSVARYTHNPGADGCHPPEILVRSLDVSSPMGDRGNITRLRRDIMEIVASR